MTIKKRLLEMLDLQLSDNVKARTITADGTYIPVATESQAVVDCQEQMMAQAVRRVAVYTADNKSLKRWLEDVVARFKK